MAFIMAMVFFGGALKGSPVLETVRTVLGADSCCHADDDSTICLDGEDTPDDNCCGDLDCDCTCCVHLLVCPSQSSFSFAADLFGDSESFMVDDYQRDHQSVVFHPPILV